MLCSTFVKMVDAVDDNEDSVFTVLDGLDRCQTRRTNLYAKGIMTWLEDFVLAGPLRVHVLVASRDEEDTRATYDNLFAEKFIVSFDEEEYQLKQDFLAYCEGFISERPDLSEGRKALVADIERHIEPK
ncbi:hypothetical protein IWX49DRAFT_59696 [Phyllosticta citricarpa]